MAEETIEIGGICYYVEALDLDRLHANLAVVSEEAMKLRQHAVRNPNEPQWLEKAKAADVAEAELRELIKRKREDHVGN